MKDVCVDGKKVELALWDTAGKLPHILADLVAATAHYHEKKNKGQETFDRLRVLAYPDSDVVLIAFSVDDPQSLENVKEKVRKNRCAKEQDLKPERGQWLPEVQHYCFKVPFFLVACKKDLRHDPVVKANLQHRSLAPVSYEEVCNLSMISTGSCN